MSTPTLWTHIALPYESYNYQCGLEEIKTWVRRSRSAPLDISIAIGDDEQEAALTLLAAHVDRWRSFRGYTLFDDGGRSIFDSLRDIAPRNLQAIHLETEGDCERVYVGHILFGGAATALSKLRRLTIDEVSINWCDHPFATPSLKYLSLDLGSKPSYSFMP